MTEWSQTLASDVSVRGVRGATSVASIDVDAPEFGGEGVRIEISDKWDAVDPVARALVFADRVDAAISRIEGSRQVRLIPPFVRSRFEEEPLHQVMRTRDYLTIDPLLLVLQRGGQLDKASTAWLHEQIRMTDCLETIAESATRLVVAHATTPENQITEQRRKTGIAVAEKVREIHLKSMDAAGMFSLQIPTDVQMVGPVTSTRLIPFGYALAERFIRSPYGKSIIAPSSFGTSALTIAPEARATLYEIPLSHTLDFGARARLAARIADDGRFLSVGLGSMCAGALVTALARDDRYFVPAIAGTLAATSAATRVWHKTAYTRRVSDLLSY